MSQDSPLSMATSIAGLLTFATAIMFAVYARALSNLSTQIELADMLNEAAMSIIDVVTLDNSLKKTYDEHSGESMVEMYRLSLEIDKQKIKRYLHELAQMRSQAHAYQLNELSRMTKSLLQAMNDLRKTTLTEFHEVKKLLADQEYKVTTGNTSIVEGSGQNKQEAEQAFRDTLSQETVSSTTGKDHFESAWLQFAPFDIASSSWRSRLSGAEIGGFPVTFVAPEDMINGLRALEGMLFMRRSTKYKNRISAFLGA